MGKPPSNTADSPEDCPLQSRELSWLAVKCRIRWTDTGFELIAALEARDPLSSRACAEARRRACSKKKLRILLAEGDPADTTTALRELYPESQDGLELTIVSTFPTLTG